MDYALFGVFPAAVDRDILIACAPRSDGSSEIRAQNLDGEKYAPSAFQPTRTDNLSVPAADAWLLDINQKALSWDSYVKAGYHASLASFRGLGDQY